MNVEFNKELSSRSWKDLRIALNERKDNLKIESPTEEQELLIEKLEHRPELIVRFNEFKLLTEMAVNITKMWTANQTLKIFFFGGQDERTKKVISIASEWSNYCSITFQATDKIEEAHLRISFNELGSWSFVGTDARGVPKNEATMNFGWLNNLTEEKEYKRVVLHEFGHALGLIHEHQSPAISINWNKTFVYWHFKFYHNWDKSQVDKNIFEEFESTKTKYSTVDKESIMGYWIPPNFTNDGTMFPLNYELSKLDKEFIKQIYP